MLFPLKRREISNFEVSKRTIISRRFLIKLNILCNVNIIQTDEEVELFDEQLYFAMKLFNKPDVTIVMGVRKSRK